MFFYIYIFFLLIIFSHFTICFIFTFLCFMFLNIFILFYLITFFSPIFFSLFYSILPDLFNVSFIFVYFDFYLYILYTFIHWCELIRFLSFSHVIISTWLFYHQILKTFVSMSFSLGLLTQSSRTSLWMMDSQ